MPSLNSTSAGGGSSLNSTTCFQTVSTGASTSIAVTTFNNGRGPDRSISEANMSGNLVGSVFASCTNLTAVFFKGNAPTTDSTVFTGDTEASIYYLPRTTGWSSMFRGRPTALWKPQVQAGDASFGVRTNQFGFNIAWASGMVVVVEACANLDNPVWSPWRTNTLTSDLFYFSDPQWTNYPARFYRLDRKSTRLNSSHLGISYAVFCLKKNK